MNAAEKNPAAAGADHSPVDFETTINKACALIDLLQSKLLAAAIDDIMPNSPSFDAVISGGLCGINQFADEVKKELIEGVSNFSFQRREVAS